MHAGALVVVVAAAAAALAVTGLSVRLLWPRNWDELERPSWSRACRASRRWSGPTAGPRTTCAWPSCWARPRCWRWPAALAFWPVRSRVTASVLRFMGLAALLCLYGIPVTDHDPGAPAAARAWCCSRWWRPGCGRRGCAGREAVPALVAVAVVGLVALPLAARVDRADALVDYSDWNWFGGKEITFDWNHSYGPLDWPRDGTTLLQVRSPRPLYWKAEVLDTFDGLRWVRSRSNDRTSPLGELPDDPDTRWDRSITVTVRSLRTDFVIGTGTPYRVLGAGEAVSGAADGTLRRLTEPLRRGDTVHRARLRAHADAPTEMRAAPAQLRHRAVPVHRRGAAAPGRERAGHAPTSRVGGGARARRGAAARRATRAPADPARCASPDSPYARTERLARRLTADAPTAYDAVRRGPGPLPLRATSPTASARPAAATRWTRSCSRTRSATASSSRARWR